MAVPQIRLALIACDKRDAAFALQSLEVAHAAAAPIHCGKEGRPIFEKCVNYLRAIILPSSKPVARENAFKKLSQKAKAQDAARAKAAKP